MTNMASAQQSFLNIITCQKGSMSDRLVITALIKEMYVDL